MSARSVPSLVSTFVRKIMRRREERAPQVEDLVASLRESPPQSTFCYVVLCEDRPLTAEYETRVAREQYILCFLGRKKARGFINKYQELYGTNARLSSLPVGDVSDLWSLLHATARDRLYNPPYGLLVDFNYEHRMFSQYAAARLSSQATLAALLDGDARFGAGPDTLGFGGRPRTSDEAAMRHSSWTTEPSPAQRQDEVRPHIVVGGKASLN